MTRSKRNRPVSRNREDFASPRVGVVFAAIFIISVLLTVFVLFMQRQWKGSGPRAILIVHDDVHEVRKPLTLALLKTPQPEALFLPIPEQQLINLVSNDVSYSSDAQIGYAQLEKYDWEYVQYIIGLEYGVVIDGIIWSSDPPGELTISRLQTLSRQTLLRQAPTTLVYWDRVRLWQSTLRLASADSRAVSELEAFLDESGAFDFTQYQRNFFSSVQDPLIRNSGWSVAILNGSGVQGYASRVAAALEMMGYQVRGVDTIETTEQSELVFAPQREEIFTEEEWAQQRLQDFFQPFEARVDEELSRRRRSDAVIILGTDQNTLWK